MSPKRWFLGLIAATALFAATSSGDPTPQWDRSSFPSDIRTRIYLDARSIPPFPDDNPSFMDLSRWPATLVIDGHESRLVVDSMCAVPMGMIVNSRYRAPAKARVTKSGPSYYWFRGKLTERAYTRDVQGKSDAVDYQYDRTGRLIGFLQRRMDRPRRHLELTMDQWYSRDGALVGVDYHTRSWFGRRDHYYWMGREVGWEEYRVLLKKHHDELKNTQAFGPPSARATH